MAETGSITALGALTAGLHIGLPIAFILKRNQSITFKYVTVTKFDSLGLLQATLHQFNTQFEPRQLGFRPFRHAALHA